MPLCLCTIAQYTFYIICMIMLPIQGHCQKKKKKNAVGNIPANSESLLLCRHILEHLSPAVSKKKKVDKNHGESSETKTQG